MAVQWIGSLSDAELLDYLPQLVQVGGMSALLSWGPTPSPHVVRMLPLRAGWRWWSV